MKFIALASASALVLGVSACSAAPPATSSHSPSEATGGLNVVAAFYPLQWAAEQVLGEHGAVETLTTPGAEAHDLELTPQQIASLPKADLVLYVEGFQPAVDDAIAQSGATALNVADVVELLPAEEHSHDHSEEGHDHSEEGHDHSEEGHDHSEEGHDHSEGHDHDHGDFDPHFWQDPTRMATLAEALGKHFGELDQSHADDYAASVESLTEELAALDEEYTAGLGTCVRREFITTHAAFGYLAKRYDLTEIGISGINPDAEPSPARIAEVQDEAKQHGVTTIFFETLTSDAVAKAIAGDLGLKTAVLDPLEGVTDKSPGADYPSIMRANLEALTTANECS